jgi:hypothetical protein
VALSDDQRDDGFKRIVDVSNKIAAAYVNAYMKSNYTKEEIIKLIKDKTLEYRPIVK